MALTEQQSLGLCVDKGLDAGWTSCCDSHHKPQVADKPSPPASPMLQRFEKNGDIFLSSLTL